MTTRKYIVAFNRNANVGLEEYDGGTTLTEARAEAAFFREHLPADVKVKIYYYHGGYDWSNRRYVEG